MLTPDNGALTGNLHRTKTSPESLALAIDILRQKFGERLQTSAAVREQHGLELEGRVLVQRLEGANGGAHGATD